MVGDLGVEALATSLHGASKIGTSGVTNRPSIFTTVLGGIFDVTLY